MKAVVIFQNTTTSLENISEAVRTHFKPQKPPGVTVWGVVASNSSKSPFVFIEESLDMNSRFYQQMLERNVVRSWLSATFGSLMSSLKTRLPYTRPMWSITDARVMSIDILTSQFVLHQALTLILGTLRYNPYRKVMFHVSYIQKLFWSRGKFVWRGGEGGTHLSWEEAFTKAKCSYSKLQIYGKS